MLSMRAYLKHHICIIEQEESCVGEVEPAHANSVAQITECCSCYAVAVLVCAAFAPQQMAKD